MIAPAVKRDVRRSWQTTIVVALLSLFVAVAVAYAFQRIVPPSARPNAMRTISVGIVANVCCALVGTYLVLRRMSLLGDAISHVADHEVGGADVVAHDLPDHGVAEGYIFHSDAMKRTKSLKSSSPRFGNRALSSVMRLRSMTCTGGILSRRS